MSVIEHGDVGPANHPSGNRGVHPIQGFSDVADEAARFAIVVAASDIGRVVRQTAGIAPGYYIATTAGSGAGSWQFIGNQSTTTTGTPPFSGPGPHALVVGKVNAYSASVGMTLELPASPADGTEVEIIEVGNSDADVTLDGNGATVSLPLSLAEGAAATQTLNQRFYRGKFKFIAAFSRWSIVRYGVERATLWNKVVIAGAGTFPLVRDRIHMYDNSANDAMTLQLPASPYSGEEISIKEVGGSTNSVTLDSQGATVERLIGIPGVGDTLAAARLYVRYKWDAVGGVWWQIGRVN